MAPSIQLPGEVIVAAVLNTAETALTQAGSHIKPAMKTVLAQAGDLTTAAEHMDPVLAHVKQLSLQLWDVGVVLNGTNGTSLKEILEPALELLKPVIQYVVKNPWVLIPILIPALDAWLLIIGFGAEGIAAGMYQPLEIIVNTKAVLLMCMTNRLDCGGAPRSYR
jgi:hypothetical protein